MNSHVIAYQYLRLNAIMHCSSYLTMNTKKSPGLKIILFNAIYILNIIVLKHTEYTAKYNGA